MIKRLLLRTGKRILLIIPVIIWTNAMFSQDEVWKSFSTSNSGIAGNIVKTLAIDKAGNKWVGTYMKGLSKFDGEKWTVFDNSNSGLPHNNINALHIDSKDRIWIGTDGGGLACLEEGKWKIYNSKNSGLPSDVVMCITSSKKGELWVGTYFGGLARFDGTTWQVYSTSNSSLVSNKIITLVTDSQGVLYVGTHGGGVVAFDGTNWKIFTVVSSKIPNNYVYSIAVDTANIKWVGTGGGGLASYNDIFWETFDSDNSILSDANIRSVVTNDDNFIWVGTYLGGLYVHHKEQWWNYNSKNSIIPDDEINSLAIENDSLVWIGTERNGLLCLRDTFSIIQKQAKEELLATNPSLHILFDRDKTHNGSVTGTIAYKQPELNPVVAETPAPAPVKMSKNNIVFLVDAADVYNAAERRKLFEKSGSILLEKRLMIDESYRISTVIYSSKSGIRPENIRLSGKKLPGLSSESTYYIDHPVHFSEALQKAYEITGTNATDNGDHHVIASVYRSFRSDDSLKSLIEDEIQAHDEVALSLISLETGSWRETQQLRTMALKNQQRFYSVERVRFIDNWSGTFQLGTSIFRGDMDVTKLAVFPGGVWGLALNKKVISSGLLSGGIKYQFNFGQLQGKKGNFSFENKYRESLVNFQVILNTWFNRNFKYEKIRPYGFVGIGMISYRTVLRDQEGTVINAIGYDMFPGNDNQITLEKTSSRKELIFPLGLGVNYKLSELFELETELSTRYINSDNLDAKIARKNDKYIFISMGISYKINEREFLANILNK